jgi:hypothetical protein
LLLLLPALRTIHVVLALLLPLCLLQALQDGQDLRQQQRPKRQPQLKI